MATAANKNTKNTRAEVVTRETEPETPTGVVKDGVYTEKNVKLQNGSYMDVEVIVDVNKLPATYGMLVSEGNGAALTIAMLTVRTRRLLDLLGATMGDLNETLPPVIERARAAGDLVIEDE